MQIPSVDSVAERKSKSKKRVKCYSCATRFTKALSGICKPCQDQGSNTNKDENDSSFRVGNDDVEDDAEGVGRRRVSTTPASEASINAMLEHFASSSAPGGTQSRRSLFSPRSSTTTPEASTVSPSIPPDVKLAPVDDSAPSSPPKIIRKGVPFIAVPISPSVKRSFDEAKLDIPEEQDADGETKTPETIPKQRKLTAVADPSFNAGTEFQAIEVFKETLQAQYHNQEMQLEELRLAQEQQLEDMKTAHLNRAEAMHTAKDDFIATFITLQSARDSLEGDIEDWKDKHARLAAVLRTTEEDRDGWKSAKQQLDKDKAGVEKDRDEWKEAKLQVDEEKARVEMEKEKSDEANALEIKKLQEKVLKLKKDKAAWVKQLTAGDSD